MSYRLQLVPAGTIDAVAAMDRRFAHAVRSAVIDAMVEGPVPAEVLLTEEYAAKRERLRAEVAKLVESTDVLGDEKETVLAMLKSAFHEVHGP